MSSAGAHTDERCRQPAFFPGPPPPPEVESSSGSAKVQRMCAARRMLLLLLAFLAYALDSAAAYGTAETLCGGELVDTLQFVCGDRGFYFITLPQRIVLAFGEICTNNYVMENVPYRTIVVELAAVPARGTACSGFMQEKVQRMGLVATRVPTGRPVGRNNRRINRGIVEECCFRSCDLALLETYCAKSVKSERDLSATSLAGLPALSKESFQKPSHAKYSKYDVWQKKSSQRLQREVPGILRARQYRWQAEGLQAAEEAKALHRPLISLPSQRSPAARASPETAGPQK